MVDFETDLVVVSGHFADPIEILKKDEIWRKKVEKSIQNVAQETAGIKENQDKMMKMMEEMHEKLNLK